MSEHELRQGIQLLTLVHPAKSSALAGGVGRFDLVLHTSLSAVKLTTTSLLAARYYDTSLSDPRLSRAIRPTCGTRHPDW